MERRHDAYGGLAVDGTKLHTIGRLEDIGGSQRLRCRPERLFDLVSVELMHALLYLLEQRRSVLRGQCWQIEGRCATARAAGDDVDVLTSSEGHVGRATGA